MPDYRNIFGSLTVKDNSVTVVGRSSRSVVRLDGPALWVAKTSADKVTEWRVYDDTAANRRALGIASSSPSY